MDKKIWLAVVGIIVTLVVVSGGLFAALAIFNDEDESSADQTSQLVDDGITKEEDEANNAGDLLNSDYLESYTIEDSQYATTVTVVVDESAGTRTITSNALPNHDTGDFPNGGNPNTISAQDNTREYPLNPTLANSPSEPREPGVALNGVKFEPGTAETATCTTGETHRIEAIQDLIDLGLDFNNAHVQPTGAYHYHGISEMLAEIYDNGRDLVHVGFAADGHMFYYSKSGAYSSSYALGEGSRGTGCEDSRTGAPFGSEKDGAFTSDWEYTAGSGDLDECNGVTIDGQYVYLITKEYPYISRCLMGEFVESGGGAGAGPPPGSRQ